MTMRQTPGYSSPIQAHHLTDYLRVIYKRRWTAGLALVAVFVYSAVGILKQTPIYQATAQLLIEKEARRATSLNSVLNEQDSWSEDDFYPTQLKVLTSRGLAWRTLLAMGQSKELSAPPPPTADAHKPFVQGVVDWVSNAIGAPKKIDPPPADETTVQSGLVAGFLGGLQIYPVKNTRIFEVRYVSPNPEFAAKAANALAAEYIKQTMDARSGATSEAMQYLSKALDDQAKKVAASDLALQQFLETNGTVAPDDRDNAVVTKLTEVNAQAMKAQGDRIQKAEQWATIEALKQKGRDSLETYPAIIQNTEVQKLSGEIRAKISEKETKSAAFGAKMVEVQQLDQQIKDLIAKKYAEEDKVVEAARNELAMAQATEQSYKKAQADQTSAALSMQRKGITYAAYEREAKANRALYDDLLSRVKQSDVSSQFKGTNIQILDKAETPRWPFLPDTNRELMTAFVKGCVLALILVFGFEYLDSRIKTPDELKTHLGLSFLGIVPSVGGKAADDPLLLHSDVPPGFSEALRAIRTSLIFSSADEGARAVVITSTAPGEGKTLVSTNLAVALAHAGLRTLIIDGDMRRPRTHSVFDRPQEPGLSNVLVGTARLRDSVRNTEVPNLYLLAAGHIPPNPAELLGSTRYLELLDEMRQEYDWVLIDAPPVMAVTDAAILANSATGVVFVVGAEMTSRRNAVAAIEQLTAARAKFIGAVLNRVDLKRHSYYYSPYYRKDYAQVYERAAR